MFIYMLLSWPLLYIIISRKNAELFPSGEGRVRLFTFVIALLFMLLKSWAYNVIPEVWEGAPLFFRYILLNVVITYTLILVPGIPICMKEKKLDSEKLIRLVAGVFTIKAVFLTIISNPQWGHLEYIFLPTCEMLVFLVLVLNLRNPGKIYLMAALPLIILAVYVPVFLYIYRFFFLSWMILLLAAFAVGGLYFSDKMLVRDKKSPLY